MEWQKYFNVPKYKSGDKPHPVKVLYTMGVDNPQDSDWLEDAIIRHLKYTFPDVIADRKAIRAIGQAVWNDAKDHPDFEKWGIDAYDHDYQWINLE